LGADVTAASRAAPKLRRTLFNRASTVPAMTSPSPLLPRSLLQRALLPLAAALTVAFSSGASASPTFVNGLALPGDLLDLSGGTTANTGRVGYFSDIYYDNQRNEWWALSDRGPGGGVLNYETRVQRFTLDVNRDTGAISNFQIAQTVKFTDGAGLAYNGLAPNPGSALGRAFDPEGFVIHPVTGNMIVSDEYGASLREFDRTGKLVRDYTIPENLRPTTGPGVYNYNPDANTEGRRINRGFEGLAISPDGRYAYAMLQSAMVNEGGGDGTIARIVKFDTATGQALNQYAYRMEGSSQGRGISALVALDDHRFLVLERNNRGLGSASELTPQNKKVYEIDLAGADDISAVTLAGGVFNGKTVTKTGTPFVDLGADTLAALGGQVPEKFEGLAIGPRLNDGSFLMLAGTDNDYSVSQIEGSSTQYDVYFKPGTTLRVQCVICSFENCSYLKASGKLGDAVGTGFDSTGFQLIPGVLDAYRVTDADLGGYVSPVPEPSTYALMFAGLGMVAFMKRRRDRNT